MSIDFKPGEGGSDTADNRLLVPRGTCPLTHSPAAREVLEAVADAPKSSRNSRMERDCSPCGVRFILARCLRHVHMVIVFLRICGST